jgi:hypothetical protein
MKNWSNKNLKIILVVIIILLPILAGIYYFFGNKIKVTNFDSCKEAGGKIQESFPAKCIYNNITYTDDIMPKDEDSSNQEGINLELPEDEKSQIEAWLEKNGYNQYGDKPDTMYTGVSPLFDESKGQYIKLYDYLVQKYPNKPWLEKSSNIRENSNTNKEVKPFATVKSWKNFEDSNFELQYPDFVNMANQNGYPVKFGSSDGFEFILEVTDKQPNYSAGTCEKKLDIDDKSLYLCYNKTITYQEIYQRMLDSFVIR